MNATKRARRHLRGLSYRLGWHLMRLGLPFPWCIDDDMRAGWLASQDADPALRKVGVRG